MTLQQILTELEKLGSEKMRAFNEKHGAHSNQFGLKLGDIRNLANKIKMNHALGMKLWNTENIDAQLLSILILDPKKLSPTELSKMVEAATFTQLADWLYSYIIKNYPNTESFRKEWMNSKNIMLARAGWSLTSGAVVRNPKVLNLPQLLDRIETEMGNAGPQTQWTMNSTLANIGIQFPEYRDRAISIGEKLGIYQDWPVSKGCTSPFAPIWIKEMVKRQGK